MGARLDYRGGMGDPLEHAARALRPKLAGAVRDSARKGTTAARGYAKVSAGAHGKHYHKAITAEPHGPLAYEYGPDSARPQGGMSFDGGSRNQPPHNDLAKSLDLIRPAFYRSVDDALDEAFRAG